MTIAMLAKPAYAGRNFSFSFMLGIDRAYHLAAVKGIAQASNFCSAGAPFPSSHVQRWLPDGCVGDSELLYRPHKLRKTWEAREEVSSEMRHGIGSQRSEEV